MRLAVLVTGGAGFIGSHTVDRLLAEGHSVRVIDNLSSGARVNLPAHHPQFEFIHADVNDAGQLRSAMSGVDSCLHLAAQISVERSLADPVYSAEQNIMGSIQVLQAARDMGLSRVVYSSSAAVYGNPDRLSLDEMTPLQPLSPYGIEKQILEQYAGFYTQTFGLSCMGLRYFNVYGPRQNGASPYSGVIAKFIDALLTGEPLRIFGDGLQQRDFIYVQDVVAANMAALQANCQGVCNVATGRLTNLLDLVRALEVLTGQNIRPVFNTMRQGDIRNSLGHVGRLREWLGVSARWSLHEGLKELLAHEAAKLDQVYEA
ncbi:UDP-glucose 4-epimerase [Methylohalomonas lacus]|uniref:UDP-glucose 4-epimerase n=1 Tax=Methylohalomonas lacus TaxID=398773 RepID=A0AAE3HM53_9GAMM|nr:NAD-dependent epimerase/dehydratase family protein [Methylohalomonas lacus]MCS3903013.1 UDP-glucose 4-epimerase [Methylohalomonas lacus]